jgi:quinol monooxygenase YgiN
MNEAHGMHVRFTTQPGRGDELAGLLLEAADALRADDDCLLYIVSRSPDDPEIVWVTEAWTSREAQNASLEDEQTRALIGRAMPLMAGRPEAIHLRPSGGKGL